MSQQQQQQQQHHTSSTSNGNSRGSLLVPTAAASRIGNTNNTNTNTNSNSGSSRRHSSNQMDVDEPSTVIIDSTSPLPLLVIEGTTSPLEAITSFLATSSPRSPSARMTISSSATTGSGGLFTTTEITLATSPERALRRVEDALVRRYLKQVLRGCGHQCSNPYCASNPSFAASFTTQQLPTLAAMLARSGPDNLCRNIVANGDDDGPLETDALLMIPMGGGNDDDDDEDETRSANYFGDRQQNRLSGSGLSVHSDGSSGISRHGHDQMIDPVYEEYMDLMQLNELVSNCRHSDDWKPLQRAVHTIFSSMKRLSNSFRPSKTMKDNKPGSADIQSILNAYSLINSCPQAVLSSMMLPSKLLLDRIKIGYEKWTADNMRGMVVLLANPLLLDSNYHSNVLCNMCDVIGSASPALKTDLAKSWIEARLMLGLPVECAEQRREFTESMETVVSVLQLFITMRTNFISQIRSPITPNRDDSIIQAVKTLAIFYEINNELKALTFKEFYNDAINENIEIKEDFPHWKAKEGDILKVESMVQMRHELQDAFFRAMFIGVNSPYLVLDIRREFIIRDALYQLDTKSPQDLKKQLKVQFVGEEAVDEGGVQKEFFQLVVREIFDPKYGIFRRNDSSGLYWFVPQPNDDELGLEELKLVGRLIGLAIYNGVILDIHFPVAVYKRLMEVSVGLEDLAELDPILAKNLQSLLDFDGDVESTFGRSFQVDIESIAGSVFSYDLKPNGADIPLTNENRKEFVSLYVSYLLTKSIDKQFTAFKSGFDSVCKNTAITLFRPEEVELLVCGSSDLDFEALQKVTTYDGGFEAETPVIKFFWETVHGFNEDQKKRLLFFATGTDRAPIGGLSKLNFVVAKNGPDSDRLPSSHTCFNVLLLPEYTSREKLAERLNTALQNAEGFASCNHQEDSTG